MSSEYIPFARYDYALLTQAGNGSASSRRLLEKMRREMEADNARAYADAAARAAEKRKAKAEAESAALAEKIAAYPLIAGRRVVTILGPGTIRRVGKVNYSVELDHSPGRTTRLAAACIKDVLA